MEKLRITVLSIHPAPYRDPFLNKLSNQDNIDLFVYNYFGVDRGHDFWILDKPNYREKNLKSFFKIGGRHFHLDIFKIIFTKFDYIVIPGWYHYTSIVAILLCIALNKRIIYVSDNIKESKNGSLIRWFKTKIVRKFKFCWVPGLASEKHYRDYFGIEPAKILHGVYSLNEEYIRQIFNHYLEKRDEIRSSLNIDINNKVILMVANLTENRDYPHLLNIFNEYRKINRHSFLLIVGKGKIFEKIELLCHNNNIENYLVINGTKFEDLPKYYAISDIYIHTGSEPYSTALSMATIFGLPAISSYNVGATSDYIIDGSTGFIIKNYSSIEEWVSRLLDIDQCTGELFREKALSHSTKIGLNIQYELFIKKLKNSF